MTAFGAIGHGKQQASLRAAYNRPPLFRTVSGSVPLILVSILAVAVVPLLDLHSKPVTRPAPPPVLIETRIEAEGFDKHHRRLPFTLYILSQQRSWKLNSISDLEDDQPLVNPEFEAAINRSKDVFCIGTASAEGLTETEEARAALRAETLAGWVGRVIREPRKTRLYRLNVGQYKGPKQLESTDQRKAIIVVTEPHEEDVDLRDALRSGLVKKQGDNAIVYSLLHYYSRSGKWLKSGK